MSVSPSVLPTRCPNKNPKVNSFTLTTGIVAAAAVAHWKATSNLMTPIPTAPYLWELEEKTVAVYMD